MTKEMILMAAHQAIQDAELWDAYASEKAVHLFNLLGYVNGINDLAERLLQLVKEDQDG